MHFKSVTLKNHRLFVVAKPPDPIHRASSQASHAFLGNPTHQGEEGCTQCVKYQLCLLYSFLIVGMELGHRWDNEISNYII